MMGQLYRPSGKVPLVGLLLGLIVAPIVAVVAAPIYAYATVYCPVVQLSVLLTMLFGAALGAIPAFVLSSLGKVRNTAVVVLFALGTAALGYLLSWVPWLYATMNRNGEVPLLVMLDPMAFTQMLASVYELGSWTIGRGDTPVSGMFLGFIWLIEAGTIFGAAALAGFAAAGEAPFCERCEKWCKNVGVLRAMPVEAEGAFVPRLLAGDVGVLGEIPAMTADARPAILVTGWRCPTCGDMATLHAQRVRMEHDRRGNPVEHRDDLVRHLVVRGNQLDWVQSGALGRPPG